MKLVLSYCENNIDGIGNQQVLPVESVCREQLARTFNAAAVNALQQGLRTFQAGGRSFRTLDFFSGRLGATLVYRAPTIETLEAWFEREKRWL